MCNLIYRKVIIKNYTLKKEKRKKSYKEEEKVEVKGGAPQTASILYTL